MSMYDKDIAVKRSVDEILSHRENALKAFEAALELLNDSQVTIQQYSRYALSNTHATTRGFHNIDTAFSRERIVKEFRKEVDKGIWDYLGSATGLVQLMDHTARKEWDDGIKNNTPECNLETLEATFSQLNTDKKHIFNRGLVRAFKSLEGRYKTNDSFKISKRIIVHDAIGYKSYGAGYINDVERVFYVLDGRKPPEYQHSVLSLLTNGRAPTEDDTDYMKLKLHLNGNVHVTFKRLDIVEKANRIIAAYHGETLASDTKATGAPVS